MSLNLARNLILKKLKKASVYSNMMIHLKSQRLKDSCCIEDESPQDDVKLKVGQELKIFGRREKVYRLMIFSVFTFDL